jgi:hypothetical protein
MVGVSVSIGLGGYTSKELLGEVESIQSRKPFHSVTQAKQV